MNTSDTSTSAPHSVEKFLVDSDVDPELVSLLRKLGFRARLAESLPLPNDDTRYLIWEREHGYILVCHDKHRDAKTRYAFHAEMYYRGGKVIRIGGQPGQSALWSLGKILAHRPVWQNHFSKDSGEIVVHPSGCNFYPAKQLFERAKYALRLPFEDPSVPLKDRKPSIKKATVSPKTPRASAPLL